MHLERYLRLLNPVVDLLPKWISLGQVLLSVPVVSKKYYTCIPNKATSALRGSKA